MSKSRFGIDARRRMAAWPTLFAVMALIAVACSGPTSSASPATSVAPPPSAASEAPASVAPSAVSGEGSASATSRAATAIRSCCS